MTLTTYKNAKKLSNIVSMHKMLKLNVFKRVALFILGTMVLVAKTYAYNDNQIESDLSLNINYEYNDSSSKYLYTKPYFISANAPAGVRDTFTAFDSFKVMGKQYLPDPILVPIAGDITIFVPAYLTPKAVGDAFVQRLFVLEQIYQQLGVRLIASQYSSESEQINQLYLAAENAAQTLNIAYGEAFPVGQWNQDVQGNLIWPELREINGQQVVVPVVYLTDATIAANKVDSHEPVVTGTVTIGGLSIGDGSTFNLRADYLNIVDNLTVQGNLQVDPENEKIVVKGLLDIYGGTVSSSENINIVAGAMELRPVVHTLKSKLGYRQVLGDIAEIKADGSIVLQSASNFQALGALVEGQEVTVEAGGDIYIGAQPLQSNTEFNSGNSEYQKTQVELIASKFSAEDAIKFIAGQNIVIRASEIISDEGHIAILAGLGITIEDELEQYQYSYHSEWGDTTKDVSAYKSQAIRSLINAGKNIRIHSLVGDVTLKAADIISADGTSIYAPVGTVELLMTKEIDQYNYSSVSEGSLTIRVEQRGHDISNTVSNTIVGGFNVEAYKNVKVEYEGNKDFTLDEQVDHLIAMPGMEWMAEIDRSSSEWTAIYNHYDEWNESSTSLSPAAIAVISVVMAVATGGATAGWGEALFTSTTMSSAFAAGATTLITQATIITANGALNGSGPDEIFKEIHSDETLKAVARSMVTSAAISYLDSEVFDAAKIDEANPDSSLINYETIKDPLSGVTKEIPKLSLTGQSIQFVTKTVTTAAIDQAIYGGQFSDNLKASMASESVNLIGDYMSGLIGSSDLSAAIEYIAHAASGCIVGAATANIPSAVEEENSEEQDSSNSIACASGAVGSVVGEFVGNVYEEQKQLEAEQATKEWFEKHKVGDLGSIQAMNDAEYLEFIANNPYNIKEVAELKRKGVDLAKLSGALVAFLGRGDVNIAASEAARTANNSAFHDFNQALEARAVIDEYLKIGVLADMALELRETQGNAEQIRLIVQKYIDLGLFGSHKTIFEVSQALVKGLSVLSTSGYSYAQELVIDFEIALDSLKNLAYGGILIVSGDESGSYSLNSVSLNSLEEEAVRAVDYWLEVQDLSDSEKHLIIVETKNLYLALSSSNSQSLIDIYEKLEPYLPEASKDVIERNIGRALGIGQTLANIAGDSASLMKFGGETMIGAVDYILWNLTRGDPTFSQGVKTFENRMNDFEMFFKNISNFPEILSESVRAELDKRNQFEADKDYIGMGKQEVMVAIAVAGSGKALLEMIKLGVNYTGRRILSGRNNAGEIDIEWEELPERSVGGASYYGRQQTRIYFDKEYPDYRKGVEFDRTQGDIEAFIASNNLGIDLSECRLHIVDDANWDASRDSYAYYGPQYDDVNDLFLLNRMVTYEDIVVGGKTNIYIKQSVVNSDEGLVAVLTHELYEIEELKTILEYKNLTMKDYDDLVRWDGGSTGRNLHTEAVIEGDNAVFDFWNKQGDN